MKKSLAFALIAQAVSIAVILGIALQFFRQLKLFNDYTDQVVHTYMVINQLEQTDIFLKDGETSSRGYIITRDDSFLEPLDVAKSEVFVTMDSLRSLISDNPGQKGLYKRLEKIVYEKMLLQIENARNIDKINHDSLMQRMQYGLRLMDEFRDIIADMKTNELVLLEKRKFKKEQSEDKLPEQVRIVFMIAGLSTLIFGLWIFVELRKRFKFQEQLQEKVLELRQNNEELEQVAFAASHDLQEPLRKIQIFSDRLMSKLRVSDAPDDTVKMAQRMNTSAGRMQELLNDLVAFNTLVQHNGNLEDEEVALKEPIEKAWQRIKEKDEDAELILDNNLPGVWASPDEILRLFNELFDNSFDFQLPARRLVVRIAYEKIKGSNITGIPGELKSMEYHHLLVIDNGTGFDENFKDKMFKLFQRLHNDEGETGARRKGMGLAMCRRIMLNLNGWIDAQGKQGEGTTIHLYFPI